MNVGIVGAGLSGLLLAYRLHVQGIKVSIFEKHTLDNSSNCALVAAGMLSPLAESITGEKIEQYNRTGGAKIDRLLGEIE